MTRAKGKRMAKNKGYDPAVVPVTPVADSPHRRPANTDPRVDGPYLDDVHAEQENAYRNFRNMQEKVRKQHNRTDSKAGTVVSRPEEFVPAERDVRELTDEEKERVGQYDTGKTNEVSDSGDTTGYRAAVEAQKAEKRTTTKKSSSSRRRKSSNRRTTATKKSAASNTQRSTSTQSTREET